MGLDFVRCLIDDLAELCITVEEGFGITIPETYSGTTVGDLIRLVQEQLQENHSRRCYSGFCFYRLRNAICAVTGQEKRSIRPSTPLVDLIPPHDEARFFRDVRSQLAEWKKILPEYQRAIQRPTHPLSIVCLGIGLCLLPALVLGVLPIWISVVGMVFMVLCAENVEFHRSDRPGSIFRKSCFPDQCRTVGDVALYMSTNLSPEDMGGNLPLPTEIATRVKAMIARIISVDPAEISEKDRLYEDLDMD